MQKSIKPSNHILIIIWAVFLLGIIFNMALSVQADEYPNLVENGDFADGLTGWLDVGTLPDEIAVEVVAGEAYLADSRLAMTHITVPSHGIYNFSFRCTPASPDVDLVYSFQNYGEEVGLGVQPVACDSSRVISETLSLVPGDYELFYIGKEIYIDDVSLIQTDDFVDVDTGLIVNGDFIGHQGWERVVDDEPIQLLASVGSTTEGAIAGVANQKGISIDMTAVYTLSFFCKGPNLDVDPWIFLIPETEGSSNVSQSYDCRDGVESFDFHLGAGSYELLIVRGSSLDEPMWLDDISLILKGSDVPEPVNPEELITNGDFSDGLAYWDQGGLNVPVVIDSGSGSAFLKDSALSQVFLVPESGIYEIGFTCASNEGTANLITVLASYTIPSVGIMDQEKCGGNAQISKTISLNAGQYLILFEGSNVLIDDVTLKPIKDYIDIDTGLIKNGDFVGTDHWIFSDVALVNDYGGFLNDEGATTNGAAFSRFHQVDIQIDQAGIYTFSFYCNGSNLDSSGYHGAFDFALLPDYSLFLGQTYTCENEWKSFDIDFPRGIYDLNFVVENNQYSYDNWVDDLSLVLKEAATPTATATETSTPLPTETATLVPTGTFTPEPTETTVNTSVPTIENTPTSTVVSTPVPTEASTATTEPTATIELTPLPTVTKIATAEPTSTFEPEPTLTLTPTFTMTPEVEVTPTATLVAVDPPTGSFFMFLPIGRNR